MKRGRPSTPADVRFWRFVDKNGPVMRDGIGPCWVWTGGRTREGYGRFRVPNPHRTVPAHRFSFDMSGGDRSGGPKTLHRCDNPPCVRPDHLFAGSAKDNAVDRGNKGRTAKGERHGSNIHPELRLRGERQGRAKLNDEAVREIRRRHAAGETCQELAREFGVCRPVVDGVVKRTSWKHVA